MDANEWRDLGLAFELVRSGKALRIDGEGWKVYKAGTIIRIDIDAER